MNHPRPKRIAYLSIDMRETSLALSGSPDFSLPNHEIAGRSDSPDRAHESASMKYLNSRLLWRSSGAALPHSAHARLPHAPGCGSSRPAHAGRRTRSRGTHFGEHAGRKNVRRIPRRFPRESGSLAENGGNAFRFSGAHRVGNAWRQTSDRRLKLALCQMSGTVEQVRGAEPVTGIATSRPKIGHSCRVFLIAGRL